jgi:hypothetical protein
MMGLVLKTLGSRAASSFSLRGADTLVIVKQINLIVFTPYLTLFALLLSGFAEIP